MQKNRASFVFFSKKRLENLVVSQKSSIFADIKRKFLDKIILKENLPKVIGNKDISFFSG